MVESAAASLRARRVLEAAGLRPDGPLLRAAETVNEVWFAGSYVLRISGEPGSRRLSHEANILHMLPSGVPHPGLIARGQSALGEWSILPRLDAVPLAGAWLGLDRAARRRAIRELSAALRLVHETRTPMGFRAPFEEAGSLECPHPMPPGRILDLLDRAARLPGVDAGLVASAGQLVRSTMGALDPPGADRGLVHGDLHLENVLWGGDQVAAVLDFEWSREGPPDLDLDILLRWLADPGFHVASSASRGVDKAVFADVAMWLAEDYPELFSHPRLRDRLTVYGVAFDVRALLQDPPRRPDEALHPLHPLRRLRRFTEGRSHLGLLP